MTASNASCNKDTKSLAHLSFVETIFVIHSRITNVTMAALMHNSCVKPSLFLAVSDVILGSSGKLFTFFVYIKDAI